MTSVGKFNKTIQKKFTSGPANAKYFHHDIQNELLDVMANMIRGQVIEEVKLAGHFALIVDESKGISKTEQISVVLCNLDNGDEHEDFLDLTPADGLDAESLHETIKQTLVKCKMD